MALDIVGPANAPNAVTVRPDDTRTFGASDTWVKDCSSSTANDGTKVQAGFVNALIGQIRNLIRGNGQTAASADIVAQNNADDSMALKAIQHLIQRGQPMWAVDSGVADALAIALTPAAAEYKAGMTVRVLIAVSNSGAPCTININGLGAKSVKTVMGADPLAGALVAGSIAEFVYDGTKFIIVSVLGAAASSLPKAKLTLAAIASLPWVTYTSHGTSLLSSTDLAPVVNSNSFSLPAGTYLFIGNGNTTINSVHASTNMAHSMRLVQNSTQIGSDIEYDSLATGQDLTTSRNMVCVATVAASDVLLVQSFCGTTNSGDFSSASASAGTLSITRLGP